jgi:hypothetical protein
MYIGIFFWNKYLKSINCLLQFFETKRHHNIICNYEINFPMELFHSLSVPPKSS